MRFWDSSAIVPLLIQQPASDRADAWFAEDRDVAMWTLSPAEITSALWRLVREDKLSEDLARSAESRADELAAASHVVMDVGGTARVARRLLRVHALTAADALQLGAALVWSGNDPSGKAIHTLDRRLAAAAQREGFEVLS